MVSRVEKARFLASVSDHKRFFDRNSTLDSKLSAIVDLWISEVQDSKSPVLPEDAQKWLNSQFPAQTLILLHEKFKVEWSYRGRRTDESMHEQRGVFAFFNYLKDFVEETKVSSRFKLGHCEWCGVAFILGNPTSKFCNRSHQVMANRKARM